MSIGRTVPSERNNTYGPDDVIRPESVPDVEVDDAFSETSINPLSNKTITQFLSNDYRFVWYSTHAKMGTVDEYRQRLVIKTPTGDVLCDAYMPLCDSSGHLTDFSSIARFITDVVDSLDAIQNRCIPTAEAVRLFVKKCTSKNLQPVIPDGQGNVTLSMAPSEVLKAYAEDVNFALVLPLSTTSAVNLTLSKLDQTSATLDLFAIVSGTVYQIHLAPSSDTQSMVGTMTVSTL